jgi:hypothetical protein
VAVVGAGGFLLLRQNSRRAWFRRAADGDVNALAAQRIGELLPAAWKNANWLVRSFAPSWAFSAAKEVEELFRAESFKSSLFKVTETVTDPRAFEEAFRAMWGFSFLGALEKNLSPADALRVMESLRREKVNARPVPAARGLYMVSKAVITPRDAAAIINGAVFGIKKPIPAGLVLGITDGNMLTQGRIREGYSARITYNSGQRKVTVTVIADKTKVELLPASVVASRGLKTVSTSYLR